MMNIYPSVGSVNGKSRSRMNDWTDRLIEETPIMVSRQCKGQYRDSHVVKLHSPAQIFSQLFLHSPSLVVEVASVSQWMDET